MVSIELEIEIVGGAPVPDTHGHKNRELHQGLYNDDNTG